MKEYKKEINKLTDTLDDLKFDSKIFIFGIGTGEYIEELKKLICVENKVVIFEPNKAIYEKYNPNIADNIKLLLFDEIQVKKILNSSIYFENIDNIYFYAFGDYSKVYKKEYDCMIEYLDWALISASAHISLAKRFKKIFAQNMIANIKILNECTPIDHYKFANLNVPAIIVSGGPSLDQNIKDMLQYKEKVKKCFIIAGNRTVGALMKNDIMPDMIVSIDPVDANYDMMKDYLDLKVPLVFYEYSNRYLVKNYKGDKIYIPLLFSQTIEELNQLKGVYSGGSVAHTCIDIANMIGCSPILLVGQDLAYTYEKHHADCAFYDYDKTLNYQSQIKVKDINGEQVNTSLSLENYKKSLEQYIDMYKDKERIKFINCSYGAEIKGAPHQELKKIFQRNIFDNIKTKCIPNKAINIDSKETINNILDYLDACLEKAEQGQELCEIIIEENNDKSLVEVDAQDIDLQRILYILDIIKDFENAPNSKYLGGYFILFVFEMKEKIFLIYAKDYEKQTSDLQHQIRKFKIYFEKMKEMLAEVKKVMQETVQEFYE
ncbi:motility associated factor glycosyltransferase family protein [[Clostridium] fimetarium]|uniref:Uncharacterized conserved protein n=1 Tax=[Clostridium] fimetarium TaxID=99656 RepID=A0A1I0Q8F1_9FIRM|nr:6-hydroxymethylpterin diphosphokinase MptE-like protein [[Clostridium] fimetarium]SEW23241.1 Uncharacterized conserved protein [[Clostridium] fimetarium]